MLCRSLCFASFALLAACSYGDVAPAGATAAVATTALAPAHGQPCSSNDDCGAANHTGGLCAPKAATKELSDGEDFLERAMSLHTLVTRLGDSSSSSQSVTILQQLQDDLSMYSQIAAGRISPDGGVVAQSEPLTSAQMQQMQDAAWMQSGVTQAYVVIRRFLSAVSSSPITTDEQKVYIDITGDSAGLHLDKVVVDLQTFLHDIEVVVAPINSLVDYREADGGPPAPSTAAGAVVRYIGPDLAAINDTVSRVKAFLGPSAIEPLKNDLTLVSQGHDLVGKDGNRGTCLGSP